MEESARYVSDLENEISSLREINAVLMDRVEAEVDSSENALSIFYRNALLEKHISERTQDLEDSNRRLKLEISDRTKAERSFLRFKAAVEQSAEGIIITDTEGVIEYANPSFLKMTGYSMDELIGAPTSAFRSFRHTEEFYQQIWAQLRLGETWKGSLQTRRSDGSLLEEEDTVSPVRDDEGNVINFVAVVRDVTKEKSLETQLRHAQKLESIGQLAAGIAHEINTPTQYVGDNTRFLQESVSDLMDLITSYRELADSVRGEANFGDRIKAADELANQIDLEFLLEQIPRSIEQTLEGIARIAHIVKAMKEFSHPGASTLSPTDINKAIASTLVVARSEWKYVAELETDLDPELPLVPCLPADFNQVILNMVVNSAHSIAEKKGKDPSEKGKIRIATRLGESCAEVIIQDSGMGIPEEIRARIFDPFFTTKEIGKGTGQGLSIAHNVIVEKHRGTIHCESEVGIGTTFVIKLPLQSERVHSDEDANTVC